MATTGEALCGHWLPAEIYGCFAEGLDTAELRRVKALLATLEDSGSIAAKR
jgi:hypothetical protein